MTPGEVVVLDALEAVYARQGRATVRAVAVEAGFASVGYVGRVLCLLRDKGLVEYTDGRKGTLRPCRWWPVSPAGFDVLLNRDLGRVPAGGVRGWVAALDAVANAGLS